MATAGTKKQAQGKARTVLSVLMLLTGMVLLVVNAVPLYELFCRVTGYGGTTQRAAEAPGAKGKRHFTIHFVASVNGELGWAFQPVQRKITVRAGEEKLAHYVAVNRSDEDVTGTATFNVTPAKAGRYFHKIQCFCFTRQTLRAGQKVNMPVSFYVDPAILKDRNMRGVSSITLSYTFFRARKQAETPARDPGSKRSKPNGG